MIGYFDISDAWLPVIDAYLKNYWYYENRKILAQIRKERDIDGKEDIEFKKLRMIHRALARERVR